MSSFEIQMVESFLEKLRADKTLPPTLVDQLTVITKNGKIFKGTNLKKIIDELPLIEGEVSDENRKT